MNALITILKFFLPFLFKKEVVETPITYSSKSGEFVTEYEQSLMDIHVPGKWKCPDCREQLKTKVIAPTMNMVCSGCGAEFDICELWIERNSDRVIPISTPKVDMVVELAI